MSTSLVSSDFLESCTGARSLSRLVAIIFFSMLAGIAVVPSVSSQEVIGSDVLRLSPVADSFVNESSPDTNYGDSGSLGIQCNSYHRYAYIMFDLSSLPPNATIIAANLGLTLTGIGGSGEWGVHIGAHYCSDDSWKETEITWNNKPYFEHEATVSKSFAWTVWVPTRRWWNITVDVRTALGLDKKLTEVLMFEEPETHQAYASFKSKEVTGVELEIEYTTKPVYVVQFESVQDTGTTSSLGNLNFSSNIFAFPSNSSIVTGSYEAEYQGGYAFLRWETEGGVSVSNPNAQKTSVTVSGSGKLTSVGSAQVVQYFFDDSTEGSSTFQSAGEMVAVRFTPLFLGSLRTARFYLSSDYDHAFKVHIMNADLSDLIQPFSQTAVSNGWFAVDLSGYNISVKEDFYITMEWLTDYYPHLGQDGTSSSKRSFEWNGTTWAARSWAFMIRAIVESKVPIRPIGVIDCLPLASYIIGGQNVTVSGSIVPTSVGVQVNITYIRPDGSRVVRKALTNTTGTCSDTFMPDKLGSWKAMATWSGNEDYEGSTSYPEEFTVSLGTSHIYLSYIYPNKVTVGSVINLTGYLWPQRFASIDMEYSLDQGETWTAFATVSTTDDGEYYYLWTPISLGTYTLRTAFKGDDVCEGSNSTAATLTVQETDETFRVYVDWRGFDIAISCNSTVTNLVFNQTEKVISFQLTGISQTMGYCNVSFSKELLGGPYEIEVEDLPVTYTETSNGGTCLRFTLSFKSTCNVKIVGKTAIPEFPNSFLLVFMIATSIAIILGMRSLRSPRRGSAISPK